jgi:Tripartite tricarboxylate transporter TctB family
MMTRRMQENVAAAVLLCVFAGVIVMSLDFGPRARMIPLPLAIFGLVLTVVQILWQNLGSTDDLRVDLISVAGPTGVGEGGTRAEDPARAPEQRHSWHREAAAYGIVAGLLALTLLAGPMPAVFLFTGGYFLVTRQYSWRASLIYTVIFTATVYLLFFLALQIQPYHGLLEPIVARFQ